MNATRMPSDSIAFAAIVAALVAVTPGCSEEAKKVEGTPCETVADCAMGEACVQNFCVSTEGGVGDGGPVKPVSSQLVSIRLDPENASLVSENGSKPTVDFEIIGVYEDETERNLKGAIFSLDAVVIGDVDGGSGVFSANGTIGGTTKITATLESADQTFTAEGTVTVALESTFLGDGVAANAADKFKAAPVTDVSKDARIVYPLDGSVLPQNVYPANIQWLRSAKNDLFQVTIEKPNLTITAYFEHKNGSFTRSWLVDEAAWRGLAQTDPDADATITIDRWVAASNTVVTTEPVKIRFAKAAITGSIYYWEISGAKGRILRIDDGTAKLNDFMPNPTDVDNDGSGCVGCHSVSSSGRYMIARHGGGNNQATVYDLTKDLTGDPPVPEFPLSPNRKWWTSAWSPDESRIVAIEEEPWVTDVVGAGNERNKMVFYDPKTGIPVPATGSAPEQVAMPSWSPDGKQIAYVSNINTWSGETTKGDISVVDIIAPDTFGASKTLMPGTALAGDTPGGYCNSYPTWSPDSKKIAFAHGTGARSDPTMTTPQDSALYAMNRNGTDPVRLAKASPGSDDFQPRFAPFHEGGYYWLSFLSRRDYGNQYVGTRGKELQQIWVTAIKADAKPGEDPSSPPYWVSGQDATARNIAAFWAPRACRQDGDDCSVGAECCGGDCRPDGENNLVCSPPPPDRCRILNETCGTGADCCEGVCTNNVCRLPIK